MDEIKEIYFDNSATTKMSEGAKKKMYEVIENHYGNPSSMHKIGLDAEHYMEEARKNILLSLGVMRGVKGELVFTSGGTEANNLAILGSIYSKKRKGNEKIMITAGEHSSVENTVSHLEESGFTVLRVPTLNGELDLNYIKENADNVTLASFMHVNNETGALYDIQGAFKMIKSHSPGAICHVDCIQSYMKTKFTPKSLCADMISISSHKVNGAKGVGALYVSPDILKAKKISPIIFGGGQENALRSGTENLYGICAFGEAVAEHMKTLDADILKMNSLRTYIAEGLSEIDGVRANLPKKNAPHILSITALGVRSETLLNALSARGICVSAGSACSSHSNKLSKALIAFGLTENEADSTIRVSLCPENTAEEADVFLSTLKEEVGRLAKKKR
jgi:cysteine desulfurase